MTVRTDAVDEIRTNGYVVLPEVLAPPDIATIKEQLAPYLTGTQFGRNDFEGFRTERVYALLAKAPAVATLVEHPAVLSLLDELLYPGYLLSANLAINVHPGETAQTYHCDDGYCYVARPREHFGVSAIWALDDFTADNGATEVLPGSHTWDATPPAADDPRVRRVEMPAGSVVVFLGSLWHRGGAHRGKSTRLGITPQYCQPWIRQIENMPLVIPPARARAFSHRVQELLGYSIHPPFIGYVDGRDPRKLLRDA